MTKRARETVGALLCVLALIGCEEATGNQLLAPNLPDSEPVDVFIFNDPYGSGGMHLPGLF